MDPVDTTRVMFSTKKTYAISRFTLIFGIAILICAFATGALLFLHFGSCHNHHHTVHEVKAHDLLVEHESIKRATRNYRLPRSISPISYDLRLIPYLFNDKFTFDGEVKILFNVTETCKNITLHAVDLNMTEFNVRPSDSSTQQILAIDKTHFDQAKQFFIVELKDELTRGNLYEVYIKYSGRLNDQLQGFYRSSYKSGNKTRFVL